MLTSLVNWRGRLRRVNRRATCCVIPMAGARVGRGKQRAARKTVAALQDLARAAWRWMEKTERKERTWRKYE